MKNYDELVELFIELCQTDSESGNEEQLALKIIDWLRLRGVKSVFNKGMIYARIGDGEPKLFCSHMDTVKPGKGVRVLNKGVWLTTDGKTILGADNKAALAALLTALDQSLKYKQTINVEILLTVREESDGGIRDFDTSLLWSKIGYVFDWAGGINRVVTKAPTIEDFRITIEGKAAHASRPEEGASALAAAVSALNQLKIGRVDKETTFNIGLINGGQSSNTVMPHLCLEGDLRSSNVATFVKTKTQIESTFLRTGKSGGVKISFDWRPYCLGYRLNETSKTFQRLKNIYRSCGLDLATGETTSGSDAAYLNSKNIFTFCLGDGVVDAHTPNERIKISDLIRLEQIIEAILAVE